jgi:hypothetical protein
VLHLRSQRQPLPAPGSLKGRPRKAFLGQGADRRPSKAPKGLSKAWRRPDSPPYPHFGIIFRTKIY